MSQTGRMTYPPLNELKKVAEDVWIVDGPVIQFGLRWLKMPFPTRMTIVRLGGNLFLHSPTMSTPALLSEVAQAGAPRWIVGPNRIHFWWIPEWRTAFPDAAVFLAPRIAEQAGGRIDFPFNSLTSETGYAWDDEIATLPVMGSYMTEFVFFHRASRTLILTDLIENFEPQKLGSPLLRWLAWLGGVQDPHGSMPRDMRVSFASSRPQLRSAVERMIAWKPQRIVLAHGRWYDANGMEELKRAFDWLLR